MQLIDSTLSFKDNLYNLFFSPTALLLHVAEQILVLNFRQPHIYHAILCSVACGAIHMKEIAEAVACLIIRLRSMLAYWLKKDY